MMKLGIRELLVGVSLVGLTIGTSACVPLVAAGAAGEGVYVATQTDENKSAKDVVHDQWITTKVKSSLLADGDVAGSNINVDTSDGVVTLRGYARTADERKKAIDIAKGIEGVKRVESQVTVQPDKK